MSIVIKEYTTKPATVQAVRITEDNMAEVAKWCQGTVQSETNPKDPFQVKKDVRLAKNRTASPRHGKGYVGDWIVRKGNSIRAFTPPNFDKEFEDYNNSIPLGPEVPLEDDENSIYSQIIKEHTAPKPGGPIIDMAARTGSTPVVKVITES